MKTILLIGLGNPGKKYAHTRHNAGFMFVDCYFEKRRDEFGFSDWEFKKSFNAEISLGKSDDKKIILLKPQTFMNLSGEAVRKALKYYKIPCRGFTSTNLIVAHDDIDLTLGKYKISTNSSSAGHNGVQNIIDMLGTKDFQRIRIGIDNRGENKIDTEKYVLGKFVSAELKIISETISRIAEEILKNTILSSRT